ncbi:hypothetical protein ACET8U_20080 [Aeromonas veronii]
MQNTFSSGAMRCAYCTLQNTAQNMGEAPIETNSAGQQKNKGRLIGALWLDGYR